MKPPVKTNHASHWYLSVFGLIVFVGVWSCLSYSGLVKAFFLPTPTRVVLALFGLSKNGALFKDTFSSLLRICTGFLCSLLIALPLGIGLGVSRKLTAFIEPLIAFIRYIPPSAFIPLGIIWFGIGEVEKIMIIFLGIAPYLTLLVADMAISTRRELMEAALTLGARPYDMVMKVIVPHALPGIWDAFRLMIGWAWSFVIIAEIVGASSGLGHMMIESQRFLRTDNIFAGIVVIGVVGLVTDYLFHLSYQQFFPWTEKAYAQAS